MRIVRLGTADVVGSFVTRSVEAVTLTDLGIEGDRHAGLTMKSGVRQKYAPKGTVLKNARQLSLVSAEEVRATATALLDAAQPAIDLNTWFAAYGANLCFEDAPQLTALPPSTRLVFPSGATVVVDGENEPCVKVGRVLAEITGLPIANRFARAALHRRGLVGWVERGGPLRLGDVPAVFMR